MPGRGMQHLTRGLVVLAQGQTLQPLDKRLRLKKQSAGAIGPWPLQHQEDLALFSLLESVEGQRRTGNIAAQLLQSVALMAADVCGCGKA
jgi:hypothetical protein